VNGKPHYYKCQSQRRPVDNLAAVEQLVHQEVLFIQRGIKTFGQVMNQFALPAPGDIKDSFDPREILGVGAWDGDKDYLKFRYRELIKKHHPDKGGDPEKFKEIQKAWEMLK
jgi:DnaJ-domain-containing protein 1